jgi:hypothetical protein
LKGLILAHQIPVYQLRLPIFSSQTNRATSAIASFILIRSLSSSANADSPGSRYMAIPSPADTSASLLSSVHTGTPDSVAEAIR